MWSNETVERRWSPDIDAYRKDYWDKKPRWREDSETPLWEVAKRRAELEQSIRERTLEVQIARLHAAEMSARAKSKHTATKDGNRADISDATISRVAGGAALGTVVGTMLMPGIGTMGGALFGGIAGAFAPRILRRKHSGEHNDGEASTRVQ